MSTWFRVCPRASIRLFPNAVKTSISRSVDLDLFGSFKTAASRTPGQIRMHESLLCQNTNMTGLRKRMMTCGISGFFSGDVFSVAFVPIFQMFT